MRESNRLAMFRWLVFGQQCVGISGCIICKVDQQLAHVTLQNNGLRLKSIVNLFLYYLNEAREITGIAVS